MLGGKSTAARHSRTSTNQPLDVKRLPAALLLTPRFVVRGIECPRGITFFPIHIMASSPSSSPAYNLLPAHIAASLPVLGSTSDNPDPIIFVKWFTPDAGWTWFVAEYDPISRVGYGLVHGIEREWGTFSLAEIEQVRGSLGLPVERDLSFSPTPASKLSGSS